MAWEWSHTSEAYAAAEENVRRLPRKTLLTILREWAYHDREKSGRLRWPRGRQVHTDKRGRTRVRGFRLPNGLRRLDRSTLAELVWQRAEDHRTCSNGGWDAYVCPDGCHTVSFDMPAGADRE